jgi:hypothetical protein
MVERDDGSYWHADSCTARFQVAALACTNCARFDEFGDYDCLGHMSNGEGIYRKRAA